MPKVGMQPVRRKELIDATILAIGERGNLDVTMSEIAGRAGVSSALAHHYFGGKSDLLQATMRQQLTDLMIEMTVALREAASPRERISTVVRVNFSPAQFRPETVTAWLAFYLEAQRAPELRRLLRVYVHRLRTNLLAGLRLLMPSALAEETAEGIGAMIDGFYIRRALRDGPPNPDTAIAIIENYIDAQLKSA